MVYTRRHLLDLRAAAGSKSKTHVDCLSAGLLRYRGYRGGARARRSRAFVYKHDPPLHVGRLARRAYDRRDRRSVDDQLRHRVLVPVRRVAEEQSPKVGVLNVRPHGNKSAAVHDIIVDKSLDLFAVVESWHDSAESPSVVATTPPAYYVIERARPRTAEASLAVNHGGLCLFVRRGVHASIVNLPTYKSFCLRAPGYGLTL